MLDKEKLKQAGLKVTTPRVKILKILANSREKHLSAEEIYQLLQAAQQEVSLATVYRVLSQFEIAGVVNKHFFEGEHAVFELSSQEHHDHIICIDCGKVEEFFDQIIEDRQEEIAKQKQFRITSHSLHIFGVCGDCNAK